MLFAALSRPLPVDGGPYAYARVAFGNPIGSYWITAWAGNAAIAVGWVLYVEHFINTGHNAFFSVLLVLIGLLIPAAINLSGVKNLGAVQVATTIVKFVAPAFMSTVGLFFISTANYTPWNVSGESTWGAIGGGMAIAVIVSGFGALNGWTMICADMPLAAAKDCLFPERFKRMSKAGVPAFGIVVSTALASVAVIVNYLGAGGADVFTTVLLMTGITAAIPYAFSALAQLKWRLADRRALEGRRFVGDVTVANEPAQVPSYR